MNPFRCRECGEYLSRCQCPPSFSFGTPHYIKRALKVNHPARKKLSNNQNIDLDDLVKDNLALKQREQVLREALKAECICIPDSEYPENRVCNPCKVLRGTGE